MNQSLLYLMHDVLYSVSRETYTQGATNSTRVEVDLLHKRGLKAQKPKTMRWQCGAVVRERLGSREDLGLDPNKGFCS